MEASSAAGNSLRLPSLRRAMADEGYDIYGGAPAGGGGLAGMVAGLPTGGGYDASGAGAGTARLRVRPAPGPCGVHRRGHRAIKDGTRSRIS